MKRKKLLTHSGLFLLFPLFLLGCSPEQKGKIRLLKTSEEMQKEVNRFITVGMPIQKATHVLEESGFTCEDHKDKEFAVEDRDQTGKLMEQTIFRGDFRSCSRGYAYILASQSWQVFLMYKKQKVTMIHTVVHWQNP
jgi:hypothetical protein